MAKVKVSGGGRCNVTNACTSIKQLSEAYPRGEKQLKKAFRVFNTVHCRDWFESRGIELVVQEDQCIFPKSQDSQTIIDCFLGEAKKLGVAIQTKKGVQELCKKENQWEITFIQKGIPKATFDKIIVATGGSPKRSGLNWLEALGHKIEDPVPSLFTFNMPGNPVRELMGIVVEKTITSIEGTKLKGDGPLLVTHWGMSGPAVLKLSAFGARILANKNYQFAITVNWVNTVNQNEVLSILENIIRENPQKILANYRPYLLPERLWHFLLDKCELSQQKRWSELGKKGQNKLINILCRDRHEVSGKTTFKEEFVTCGGVSLESINFNTMESKVCPGIYFAGEVMDIDGITGGYNFQSAWTTGWIAGGLGKS